MRSVFVTGAAAGIGRATVLKFVAQGCLVGAVDVDVEGLASLEAEATRVAGSDGAATAEGPGRVWTARLDVTDAEAWEEVLGRFVAQAGRLDVLVNNAGHLRMGRFSEVPTQTHLATVRVNVDGVLLGCHTAYPYLRATPGAQVVNLCSASAIYGQAELAAYSATKFAVRGLTEALDLEWGAEGIGVTALWPLFVDTAMVAGQNAHSVDTLGVRLEAEDVADAVVDAVRPGGRHRVHRPVGRQATVLYTASQVAPAWVLRAINRRIAGV